jgi:pyridoxamine 5'-phosphate oxidase
VNDAWLAKDPLPGDPMPLIAAWLDEAWADGRQRNPHAIALATADRSGKPSVRLVLCNEVDVQRGAIVFYSHRLSRKGTELAERPEASAVFHFHESGRQVRLEGPVDLLDDASSDAYFASRPIDAQVGAWASRQSAPIASREALEARIAGEAKRLGVEWPPGPRAASPPRPVPRPPHWGGFRLWVERAELWASRPARIHDRAHWARNLEEQAGVRSGGPWRTERLQP